MDPKLDCRAEYQSRGLATGSGEKAAEMRLPGSCSKRCCYSLLLQCLFISYFFLRALLH